ncbi:GPI transamidase subunit PIG-U [Mucidula mucida]|nr:GPI transamidase subunit PIG-U [Mucidula mucida]
MTTPPLSLPAPTLRLVFAVLVASRLLLSSTSINEYLIHDHQLSSPLTSYLNLQEGIYLFQNGINPYSGGVFRHSPLYLSFFTTFLSPSKATASVIWTLCDSVGALSLVRIWRARQRVQSSPRDSLIAVLYFLNPYLLLPSLAYATSSIENTLMLLSIICIGKVSASLLALAFSYIFLPITLLLLTDPGSHLTTPKPFAGSWRKAPVLLLELAIYFSILTLASTIACNGFSWVPQTWGATLTLPDLTPNPGLWWYFFTEMFDHFRPFFLMVFSVHLLIYIAPICIKFQYDALYAPYPTMSDPGIFLSMISLFPETYPFMRHPIGTGNANFFYASTLVFACANGATLVDCTWAGLRIAIGKDVGGYAVTQE